MSPAADKISETLRLMDQRAAKLMRQRPLDPEDYDPLVFWTDMVFRDAIREMMSVALDGASGYIRGSHNLLIPFEDYHQLLEQVTEMPEMQREFYQRHPACAANYTPKAA
jgi:hypothetical protein